MENLTVPQDVEKSGAVVTTTGGNIIEMSLAKNHPQPETSRVFKVSQTSEVAMAGITSVAQEFADFAAWLGEKSPEKIQRIWTLNNGFEGWLKLEFFFWLTSHRQEMLRSAGSGEDGDVGLDNNLRLDQHPPEVDRGTKRCDLWVRDSLGPRFHYVELKAPFASPNEGNVLTSVGKDFWYMARIRNAWELAASGNAVVLGVGFDEEHWRDGINRIRHSAGIPVDTVLSGEGVLGRDGAVRWCVLTKTYFANGG